MSRYIIISPVRDEAPHIELTLRSVTTQRLKPLLWVIVDDGSSDDTPLIVREYAAAHPFIKQITTQRAGVRNTGSAEVLAFYKGLAASGDRDVEFLVKLDGDLSFGPDYFERLLSRFAADPRLGIASGVYLEEDRAGEWRRVGMPPFHAFGACKVVRRTCFEAIAGFASRPGWDTADEIRAWSLGWKTRHFEDLETRHHKAEGSAMGLLSTSRMYGEIHYVTGGDPLVLLFKMLHRARLRPFVLGALALGFGFVEAAARRAPRLVSPGEAHTYRRLSRRRLWSFARNPGALTEYWT